ncbi:hypothetical protein [Streptomyces sp. SCSIO ZS0520]|uniref:hypothetical protein n=1 Tax=Streptomyces sp. SCSIO ZS0520 TaxID=2892996 RepID=UPI0021D86A5B|nr:hypothetical protein [Streptomyces sp. SCSIO ZS0520]
MPRSVFLGRVVAAGEPLWLDEDRAWAFALAEVEADACPECGQPWGEATDPASEEAYRAELIRCHACSTSASAVRAYQDKGGKTEGLHVHIEKR